MKVLHYVILLFTFTTLSLPTLADAPQSNEDTWLNQRTGDILSDTELRNMYEFVLPSNDEKNKVTQSKLATCKVICNISFVFGNYLSVWDTIGMDGLDPGLEFCQWYNCNPQCSSLPQC